MEITASTPTAIAAASNSTTDARGAISSDFETFLKMLTTQMQNQDPLDPVKSEDFAVQLATFSSVEQQVLTNDLLESLGAQMALTGMSQLANWVGMEARAPVAGYFDGQAITLLPDPKLTADNAELVVRNAAGAVVQRLTVPVSDQPLQWTGITETSGTLPDAVYDVTVESYSDGVLVSTDPAEVYAQIAEARVENGETVLVTTGGATVAADAVTGLRDPLLVI